MDDVTLPLTVWCNPLVVRQARPTKLVQVSGILGDPIWRGESPGPCPVQRRIVDDGIFMGRVEWYQASHPFRIEDVRVGTR